MPRINFITLKYNYKKFLVRIKKRQTFSLYLIPITKEVEFGLDDTQLSARNNSFQWWNFFSVKSYFDAI